jgi:glycosyltransferase involved in cell wall biosynthesis
MYFGAHGRANGLENVLRTMDLARRDPNCSGFRLRLVGDGPSKAALQQLATTLGLGNVSFEPPVAKAAIPTLAGAADAFVFNLLDAPVFRFGISSNKLFDYLAAGRPIVFCCDAGNNPVAEAGSGVTVPPGDPAALLEAMKAIATMSPTERTKLGQSGRDWVVKHHSYESLAAKLSSTLAAVLEEHKSRNC